MSGGSRSKPVGESGLGKPGVRVAGDRRRSTSRDSSDRNGYIRSGPSEQLSPTDSGLHVLDRVPERLDRLRRDHRLAAAPDRRRDHDRQLACRPASKTSRMATSAALALSESKMVSTSSTSDAARDQRADLLRRRRSSPDRR